MDGTDSFATKEQNGVSVHIYDKEVIDTTNILLVYVDDRGRVMRKARLRWAKGLQAADTMISTGQNVWHRW